MKETIDFGAPSDFGLHHFYVEIPEIPEKAISIHEYYGFDTEEKQEPVECRVTLARELWNQIRDEVRRDFNSRLKANKQSIGSWKPGKTKLDRFLGRELCVLAWAAEHASVSECQIICQRWKVLRPEERWWLFMKTASEAGQADQKERGWRKALYCALSDGHGIKLIQKVAPKKNKKTSQATNKTLFDES